MTTDAAIAPLVSPPHLLAAGAVAATGSALLLARPVLIEHFPAVPTLVFLFAAMLLIAVAWPTGARRSPAAMNPLIVLLVGILAFGLGRILGGGHPPIPFAGRLIALNSFAAIAEEAFFRRFVYELLLLSGTTFAIVGSAVLFAVVHVTVYGAWVLPVDIAAGLVLGWQRAATGSWTVPALTHIVANVLVVL